MCKIQNIVVLDHYWIEISASANARADSRPNQSRAEEKRQPIARALNLRLRGADYDGNHYVCSQSMNPVCTPSDRRQHILNAPQFADRMV